MKPAARIASVVFVCALTACSEDAVREPGSSVAAQTTEVAPGDEVFVSVPVEANHRWFVFSDGGLGEPTVNEIEGSVQVFKWRATPGEHVIHLAYAELPRLDEHGLARAYLDHHYLVVEAR